MPFNLRRDKPKSIGNLLNQPCVLLVCKRFLPFAFCYHRFPEQAEIAKILQACDTKIAALEQEAARLDELFHAMLDELMTGKRSSVPLIDSGLPQLL